MRLMSGVQKLTLADLTQAERDEVEQVLKTDGFVSDEGDTMAWYLLLFLVGLFGVGAGVTFMSEWGETFSFIAEYPSSAPMVLVNAPHIPGFFAGLALMAYCAVHFLQVHKRHGWLAPSFGVVRLRGKKVRLLRYQDLASCEREQFGNRGRRFSVLTMKAKDGTKLVSYATRLFDGIQARAPKAGGV